MLLGIYTSNHVFLLFFKCCCNKYETGVIWANIQQKSDAYSYSLRRTKEVMTEKVKRYPPTGA